MSRFVWISQILAYMRLTIRVSQLFKDQKESDKIIEDAACMIGCPRDSLNVVASAKGQVVGRLSFRDDGDKIDCTKMGVAGTSISPFSSKITDIQSDAKVRLHIQDCVD